MNVNNLTGQDLVYWVAKANGNDIKREHYGDCINNELIDEPSMRDFVSSKFGKEIPEKDKWQ